MSANSFYDSRAWRRVRREVMAMDHNECQFCRQRRRHTPGVIVHHSFHLDRYPEYGLSVWVEDPDTGERRRNLITVCRTCHETVCHPERMAGGTVIGLTPNDRSGGAGNAPLTPERW